MAGFIGTVAITLVMYSVSPIITGGPMDIAGVLAGLLGTSWLAGIGAVAGGERHTHGHRTFETEVPVHHASGRASRLDRALQPAQGRAG